MSYLLQANGDQILQDNGDPILIAAPGAAMIPLLATDDDDPSDGAETIFLTDL